MPSRILAALSLAVLAAGCTTEERCAGVTCEEGTTCDSHTGSCRPNICLFDTQCGGRLPLCDSSLHFCVQCIQHEHCATGQRCSKKIAGAGVCEEAKCTTEAECAGIPGREHCDVDIEKCGPCLTDAHCPLGQTCQAATAAAGGGKICVAPVRCAADAECLSQAKPHCDLTSYKCEACVLDEHCPAQTGARVCNRDTHACSDGPCDEDADCAGAEDGAHCSATTGQPGRCAECTLSAHCNFDSSRKKCHPTFNVCLPCVRDTDCQVSRGFGCSQTTFQCVYQGCLDDSMCYGAERCKLPQRDCVRCLNSAECTLGGRCDDAVGQCVGKSTCSDDTDCAFPQMCGASGRCVECEFGIDCTTGLCSSTGFCLEPDSCTDDHECEIARICAGGACDFEDGCSDDLFEPNNSTYRAAGVETDIFLGTLCRHDADWYSMLASSGDRVKIEVRYDRTLGTLQLQLLRNTPAGPRVIAGGQPSSLGAVVEVAALPSGIGPLYLGITGATKRTPYRVLPTIVLAGGCVDDRFEIDPAAEQCQFGSTNDTLNCPTSVGASTLEAISCPSDDDWFRISVPAGKRVVVRAPNDGDPFDIFLYLYYLSGTTLFYEDVDDRPESASSSSRAQATDYWVRVVNFAGTAVAYELEVSFLDPQPTNDSCEPPLSARVLQPGVAVNGTLVNATDDFFPECGGDGAPDVVYRLRISQPQRVRVQATATFNLSLSAIKHWCRFTDAFDYQGCSDQDGVSEVLDLVLPFGNGSSDFYFVVEPHNPSSAGTFSIRADVFPAPPSPVGDRCNTAPVLDGSTAENVALAIDDGRPTCGLLGRGDAFYRLVLDRARSARIALDAQFEGASLALRSGACTTSELACAAGRAAEIVEPVLPQGEYRIMVDGGGPLGGAYSLSVSLDEPLYPPTNDSCASSDEILPGLPVVGSTALARNDFAPSCIAPRTRGADVVWRFTVPAGPQMRARLGLDAQFDGVLAVYAACGTQELFCADAPPPRVDLVALDPGTYYAVVDAYSDGLGEYELFLSLDPAPPVPGNDQCANAAPLAFDVGGHASIVGTTTRAEDDEGPSPCTGAPLLGPDVAYTVTLAPGQTLSATVEPNGFDAALYLMDVCAASFCLGGADRSYLAGGAETVTYTHPAGAPATTLYLVVDSYDPAHWGDFVLSADRAP